MSGPGTHPMGPPPPPGGNPDRKPQTLRRPGSYPMGTSAPGGLPPTGQRDASTQVPPRPINNIPGIHSADSFQGDHSKFQLVAGASSDFNIDPTQLPSHQHGYPLPPPHNFHIAPGALANFSFQHVQQNNSNGNSTRNQLGTGSDAQEEARFETPADEYFYQSDFDVEGCLERFARPSQSSSYFPSNFKSRDYTKTLLPPTETDPTFNNGGKNSLHVPTDTNPAFSNGGDVYTVMAHHGQEMPATGPQAFYPTLPNSNNGRSVGVVEDTEESAAQAQPNASMAKKRGRSEPDMGGSASSSSDGHLGNDLPAAPPMPRAKRARTSKAEAHADSPTDSTTLHPTRPGRPAAQTGGPKKATRKQSILAADFSDTEFGEGVYQDLSVKKALKNLVTRHPMTFELDEDDVEEVKANKEYWVRAIVAAFGKPYSEKPETIDFKECAEVFKPWQYENYCLTMGRIQEDKTGSVVEAAATVLFLKVVKSHEKNSLEEAGCSIKYNCHLTCSERMGDCVEVIEKLAIIRHDLIMNTRFVELIGNPKGMMNRKEQNKYDNYRRGRKNKVLSGSSESRRGSLESDELAAHDRNSSGPSGDRETEHDQNIAEDGDGESSSD